MEFDTFKKAVNWALRFARQGTQRELNLFGVGEPTLHPQLVDMVAYARDHLPFAQTLHLNTNGNQMTEALARRLKDAGVNKIDITGHNHFSTARTIKICKSVGIQFSVSYDFALHPNNWAGQVDWFEPDYDLGPCPWIERGQVMVMSDGRVTTCCIDAFGRNVFATIDDDLPSYEVEPSDLCKKCHHSIPSLIAVP